MELPEQQPGQKDNETISDVQESEKTTGLRPFDEVESEVAEKPAEPRRRTSRFDIVEEIKKPSEDRVVMLSDGIFAIAITLLVLSIQIPLPTNSQDEEAFQHILHTSFLSETISYIITFTVLAFYWINHRDLMHTLKRFDRPFVLLNMLFLAFVAFFPVASNFLHYDQFPEAVVIYTVVLAGCGYSSLLLWFYAYKNNLFDTNQWSSRIRTADLLGAATSPTFFLLSLLILLIPRFYPGNLFYVWLALPVIAMLARTSGFFGRHQSATEAAEAAEPHQ